MTSTRLLPLAAAAILITPAAASANTISEITADPARAEVPTSLHVRGTAVPSDEHSVPALFVTTRSTGGPPCATRPEHDPGQAVAGLWARPVSGEFVVTGASIFPAPGSFVLCAWIAESGGGTAHAVGQVLVTAARPLGRLAIAGPARVRRGAIAKIVVAGASEAVRGLYVNARPSRRPGGCGPSPDTDRGDSVAAVHGMLGDIRQPILLRTRDVPGLMVCAWLATHTGDAEPMVVARRFIPVIGRPHATAPRE
jgi:hypothetical protein